MSEEKDDVNQKEIQDLMEVKKVLESEVMLQKEIMKTSIQLGFSFVFDSEEDDLDDSENPEICDEDILTLEFNQRCLDLELKALKGILYQRNNDLKELKTQMDKQNKITDNDYSNLASNTNNQQLLEDIVRGDK